jgi:hypothetical protein
VRAAMAQEKDEGGRPVGNSSPSESGVGIVATSS